MRTQYNKAYIIIYNLKLILNILLHNRFEENERDIFNEFSLVVKFNAR